jgi:hypothetical protein
VKQKEALHTAARRYLIERAEELARDVPVNPRDHSPEQRDRWARSGELLDFLERVERATPHPPGSAAAVRDWLLAAVREPLFVGKRTKRGGVEESFPPSADRLRRRVEEAGRFSDYLLGLTGADLQAVAPLPYRRTLSEAETDRLHTQLGARWDLTPNHWYSSGPGQDGRERLVLRLGFARRPPLLDALRRALFRQGVTRLWSIPASAFWPGRELDLELFDLAPRFPCDDLFWTAGEMDWVIFGSHEPLITLAGDDLVQEFCRRVPSWPDGQCRGFEDYSRTD